MPALIEMFFLKPTSNVFDEIRMLEYDLRLRVNVFEKENFILLQYFFTTTQYLHTTKHIIWCRHYIESYRFAKT